MGDLPHAHGPNMTLRAALANARFLNMLSALEALITLGKCRELPVVGFVGDVLIMGIIVSLHVLFQQSLKKLASN